MKKKTVKDISDLRGASVFMRVDFNISLHNGKIANDTRIVEAIPTIEYLLKKGAKVILSSHLGRPNGEIVPDLSLRPVVKRLSELIRLPIQLVEDFWQRDTISRINSYSGNLLMLENIRFHPGEEQNDPIFAKHLAAMSRYFVNDAFGASHRVHVSTVGLAEKIPAYAGLLMADEIRMLSGALESPKRPFLVIIGGAKTPEKIRVIDRLLERADTIALGGAVANTFLAAWGFGMGNSLVDHEMIEKAKVVYWEATKKHAALLVPHDVVISDEKRSIPPRAVRYTDVPQDACIYDIGPNALAYYCQQIQSAKTIIWNGPMGLYEDTKFRKGTDTILKEIAKSHAFSIIGGGDTLTSIRSSKSLQGITHVSTGGSAMLEFIEKGTLPGIDVLLDA